MKINEDNHIINFQFFFFLHNVYIDFLVYIFLAK